MCNPPFYSSSEELLASAKEKQRPPFSACTGAEIEMVTPGGEVAFVSCIIRESLKLRNRVEWYTTMLGKLASVSVVVTNLKEAGVTNWAVTEFVQGSRTRRWGVAWSWGNMRPKMDLARGISSLPKHLLPFPSEVCFINLDTKIDTLGQCIHSAMQELPIKWRWKPSISTGIGISAGNVWSRASRRRHARGETNGEEIDEDEEALGFKITLKMRKGLEGVDIIARWLLGHDALVFESFCGMLQRKIKESQQAPIETRSDISSSIRG
ncbi:MAG: hypothetical protein M1827_001902 [Pycnora praestabilis]|nr:MAG: hypothetical protein M1827_001902 [Pycnora praestabilis]